MERGNLDARQVQNMRRRTPHANPQCQKNHRLLRRRRQTRVIQVHNRHKILPANLPLARWQLVAQSRHNLQRPAPQPKPQRHQNHRKLRRRDPTGLNKNGIRRQALPHLRSDFLVARPEYGMRREQLHPDPHPEKLQQ